WSPQGLQMVLDELQHLINPLLFIIYWILYSNKKQLPRNAFWPWLIFPLVYIFFVLVRGNLSDFYPYPFLDVTKLGFNSVLSNCIVITILFMAMAVVFNSIGNYISKRRSVTG
ncbi:MAG: Pr6Pr family membrane protein, partial [Bacteroidota bacterium]